MWATALSVLKTGALPKWIAWVMILLAVVGFTPAGYAAAIGTAMLVLMISILQAVRERSAPLSTPQPT